MTGRGSVRWPREEATRAAREPTREVEEWQDERRASAPPRPCIPTSGRCVVSPCIQPAYHRAHKQMSAARDGACQPAWAPRWRLPSEKPLTLLHLPAVVALDSEF